MNTTFLYTLADPETGKIRYVGKSDNPFKRFKRHLTGLDAAPSTHKKSWIKNLRAKGLVPHMDLLDEIPASEWQFWEREYLRVFRMIGMDLVNLTAGGDGTSGWIVTPETRAKISAAHMGVLKGPCSPEVRANMSAAQRGATRSPAQRAANEARRGVPWSAARRAAFENGKGINPV